MDDYLSKPVPREALASTLRKWITTPGTPPPVETAATAVAAPGQPSLARPGVARGTARPGRSDRRVPPDDPSGASTTCARPTPARTWTPSVPWPTASRARPRRSARAGWPTSASRSKPSCAGAELARPGRAPHRAGSRLRGRERVAARGAAAGGGAGRELAGGEKPRILRSVGPVASARVRPEWRPFPPPSGVSGWSAC